MSIIQKILVGMLIISTSIVVSVGILSSIVNVNAAQNFKGDVVAAIQDSNFNTDVINSCISTAAENGYILTVTTYDSSSTVKTYTSSQKAVDTTNVYMATVLLDYQIKIPFLSPIEKTLRGNT